jgi:antitoxin component YwqK of YwqJK toxin-antitoxin module
MSRQAGLLTIQGLSQVLDLEQEALEQCFDFVSIKHSVPRSVVVQTLLQYYTYEAFKPKQKKRRPRKPLIDPELLKEPAPKAGRFMMEFEYDDQGLRTGQAVGTYATGEPWGFETYSKDRKVGPKKVFHRNGLPYLEEEYGPSGQLIGRRRKWNEKGVLEEDQTWSHGRLVDFRVIHQK